jgi:uncharacterized membrane protein YfcA
MFTTWILLFFSAMIIGMSKAGLKGVEMLSVTIMAFIFGGKSSTGIVLPLLCFADILAVIYYNRHAQWNHFKKIIPWMMTGILLGVFIGKDLNEFLFKKIMASIILITIAIVLYMEYRKSEKVPTNPFFVASTGLAAGFTTMIGNLAGAFANLYFLAMRVSKNDFIGTAAWIFLCMNLFKLPFQVFYWKNINWQTFSTDLYLIPGIIIGFFIGVKIIHKIKDHHYRKLVILLTLIGSVVLLIQQ